ncbi:hypothetical protein KFU94_53055 [Chloroflexi bacterium TSY]|nr:hypothetical protein [Chloroflexi bacterium TSY]
MHVEVTVIKNGGGLLAAYADDGPIETGGMVGAVFWWMGVDESIHQEKLQHDTPDSIKLKICSHMAGVMPEWQGRGLGRRLKWAQRATILEQGLTDHITWTYDPLVRPNAILNLHRLGAVCNTYKRNVYGDMQDALNKGTPSDRCQVDWFLRSTRVEQALAHDAVPDNHLAFTDGQVCPVEQGKDGFLHPIEIDLKLDGTPIAIPLPNHINAIRQSDGALSLAWRLYMRHMLEAAFKAGYLMIDCVQMADQITYYILHSEPIL